MTDEELYQLACKAASMTPLTKDGGKQIVFLESKDQDGSPVRIYLTWAFQYDFLRNFLSVVSEAKSLDPLEKAND